MRDTDHFPSTSTLREDSNDPRNVSEGRIIVGVGAGWAEPEFRMFSTWHPYKERYAQFLEALQLLTQAWTKESVNFSGQFHCVQDCVVEPKPAQKPHPPLPYGGWSNNRILRLAGAMGDGWTPTGPRNGEAVKSPSDYNKLVLEIEKGRKAAGRASKEVMYGCRFGPLGNPGEYLREIENYKSAGLNCYPLGVKTRKHSTEVLRRFGDAVIATS